MKRSFASDNNSGIHPEIFKAISDANFGHAVAYGADSFTEAAISRFKEHFGQDIDVYFTLTGTAANVLGLKAVTKSFQSVICAQTSHIHIDECGAPESVAGVKLQAVPPKDGKLSPEIVGAGLRGIGDQHHVQPRVISISQTTELGTVYSVEEIRSLADFAHQRGMLLHMDGARISNAAARLGLPLRACTRDAGVDLLSFGGTKNGMMGGEAVVFFNAELSVDFKYIRKQGMQLASKMRFVSAQFTALLSNDLWLRNATHANQMAKRLAEKLRGISAIKVSRPVEANAVFAEIPPSILTALQKQYYFYVWEPETTEVRWMTSFDTTDEDIEGFVSAIQKLV
jgi:threonine aldolase